MISPRPYQQECHDAVFGYFSQYQGNPLLVLPTGAGKSVILALLLQTIMTTWTGQRILVLTHVKELIEQNTAKLLEIWPDAPLGIYAAALRRRDMFHPLIFASIQSVYKIAERLGIFDLVFIDECHLVPNKSNTMYRAFLDALLVANPNLKVIGLSATPFRLGSGYLHMGDDRLFTHIAYEVTIPQLIKGGFLVPPVSKGGIEQIDRSVIKKSGGEFVASDVQRALRPITERAIDEICELGAERKSWMVFCPTIEHAEETAASFNLRLGNGRAASVSQRTPKKEREAIVRAHKAGELKVITNRDILTTGYDAPAVDLLAMFRATKSASLYIQMIGRGMRPSPGKDECLVLDYAGNVEQHGPVDAVQVREPGKKKARGDEPLMGKTCPECRLIVGFGTQTCPECGYEWELAPMAHRFGESASSEALLTSQIQPKWLDVKYVFYRRHQKAGSPDSLKVTYVCGVKSYPEWVCVEHTGMAGRKARHWFAERGLLFPNSVQEALDGSRHIPKPRQIKVIAAGRYDNITDYRWDETAERIAAPSAGGG